MHMLISGQTESGKSSFARRLITDVFNPANRPVLVLDDVAGREYWGADWVTDDPVLFLKTVRDNLNCAAIVDEGGSTIGRYNTEMEQLATKMRHLGHNCVFISQRPVLLPKTIRTQCGAAVVFNSCAADCKALAEDFNAPELMQGTELEQGEYLYKVRFRPTRRGRLFVPRNTISSGVLST